MGSPTAGRPVFTDLSGRRRQQMRRIGLGVIVALLACISLMAAGLLGGPRASVIPWGAGNTGDTPASPQAAARASTPAAHPAPGPPLAQRAGFTPAGTSSRPPSSAASRSAPASTGPGSASPAPAPTNRGGKTPQGHPHTPHPSPSGHLNAG